METVVAPPVALCSLFLKDLKLGGSTDVDVQAGVLQLYAELKEDYDLHERAVAVEYAGEQDEDVKQACKQASLLFVARVLFAAKTSEGQAPINLGVPISRIVAASGINLLDFFREANVVVSKLSAYLEARGSSSKMFSQLAQLKEHSETVVVMGLLAKKYKDHFNLFLHQLDYYKQVVLRLGWNAFLVLKVKLLSAFPDVVSCVELLPCIFAILVSHAPRLPDSLMHISHAGGSTLLLKAMSETCKADYKRVQARMSSVELLLTQILTTAVPEWRSTAASTQAFEPAPTAAVTAWSSLDLVANPVLEGLVTDNDRMNRAVAALEREYELHYTGGGHELDERDFLYTDFTKFASPRFSPGQMHSAMSKLGAGQMALRPGGLLGPGAHTTAPLHAPITHHMPMYVKMGVPPGLHSPLPMMNLHNGAGHPGTPVSEAMGASAWVRGITSSLGAEPSSILQRFLAAIKIPSATGQPSGVPSVPPVQQLSRRVWDMVTAVIPDDNAPSVLGPFPLLQPSLAVERRLEAVKLFYHSLEAILVAEEKATGITGVAALLSSMKFHRGLVACCVEVVAACYRMVSCAFPKVLDALHIKAFDLAKMIQSFVKSVATLPRELKRHLYLIEEKILESLAWEPGSSLYYVICSMHSDTEAGLGSDPQAAAQAACLAALDDETHQSDPGSKRGLAQLPVAGGLASGLPTFVEDTAYCVPAAPSTMAVEVPMSGPPPSPKRTQASAFSVLMSPAKKARGTDGTARGTQAYVEHLPLSVGPPPVGNLAPGGAAGALFDFFRKVMKLAAFRLALMCEHFDFSPLDRADVSSRVYETIEHALYRQTHLFYNRHIDQIMLSALYGYCKVHKLQQVSFREIIAQYRKQPQSQQPVFRSVVIEQSMPGLQISSRADIIAFYNQVFVPAMKSFLLQGETGASVATGGDSNPAPNSSGSDAGAAAGWAGSSGNVNSRLPLGLPPLPPRQSSQSPRGPKLPAPISVAIPPHFRVNGPSASFNPQVGTDSAGLSPTRRSKDSAADHPHGPVGSNNATDDSSSVQPLSAPAADTHHVGSVASLPGTAGGHTRSLSAPRARMASTADHKIPDGLAALLQALDSQQSADHDDGVGGMGDAEDKAGMAGIADIASGGIRAVRDRSARRSGRHMDTQDDDEGPGDVAGPGRHAQPLPVFPAGRRQRTPNRRYGSNS